MKTSRLLAAVLTFSILYSVVFNIVVVAQSMLLTHRILK